MSRERIKVLWLGDMVTPTGFSRVNHSIMKFLPKDRYELEALGINYYGDPHPYPYVKIYPASSKGHIYGFNRVAEFEKKDFDIIFILNDLWIVNEYLNEIKKWKKIPKIVVYTPMDSTMPDEDWFKNYDIVTKLVVYTKFGYNAIKEVAPNIEPVIIPHGVDSESFHKSDRPVEDIRMELFGRKEDFIYSWIVLNANRNQPRKRIDVALEGFALFAKGKPINVKYYHHAGISDVGWDVLRLVKKLGKIHGYNVEERLIVTNLNRTVQTVPDARLNLIYNVSNVGLNTSLGEGWGLTNVEHAITGAPQVVPDHSSCKELFENCGLLIPTSQDICFENTLTFGKLVKPEDVAEKLELLYTKPELGKELSDKALAKFLNPEYSWKNISRRWDDLFRSIL